MSLVFTKICWVCLLPGGWTVPEIISPNCEMHYEAEWRYWTGGFTCLLLLFLLSTFQFASLSARKSTKLTNGRGTGWRRPGNPYHLTPHCNWSLLLSLNITLMSVNSWKTRGKSLLYLLEVLFHRIGSLLFASSYSVSWGLIINFLINALKDKVVLCRNFCLLKFNAFLSVISYIFSSYTCKVKLSRVRRS